MKVNICQAISIERIRSHTYFIVSEKLVPETKPGIAARIVTQASCVFLTVYDSIMQIANGLPGINSYKNTLPLYEVFVV